MKDELNSMIKESMLSKNDVKLRVLRFIKSEFTKFETAEKATELTELEEQKILTKMVKQREDSINEYNKAGRNELASDETDELNILLSFLPKEPSREELISYVDELINSKPDNLGGYIKAIKAKFPLSDGKLIADLVKEKMSKK